jgi:hypothetical protein
MIDLLSSYHRVRNIGFLVTAATDSGWSGHCNEITGISYSVAAGDGDSAATAPGIRLTFPFILTEN